MRSSIVADGPLSNAMRGVAFDGLTPGWLQPVPAHSALSTHVSAAVTACVLSYLYGSLPVVYLLGRSQRIDLRATGSGNVGATNLMAVAGPTRSVIGWVADASKGLLPVMACRAAGLPEPVAEMAGVCGVVGQCWPLFLRLRGGRGISAFVGASAVMLNPAAWALTLAPLAGGGLWRVLGRVWRASGKARSKSVPFGCFVGMLVFALLGLRRGDADGGTSFAPMAIALVLLLRRLTAHQPDDTTRGPTADARALIYRLLYDRNTGD